MRKFLCILMALLIMVETGVPILAAESTEPTLRTTAGDGVVEVVFVPQEPSMNIAGTALSVAGTAVSAAGRYIYTYMVNNEIEDAPILSFAASFAAGVEASKLIEIQKTLSDMTEQLTAIQSQISNLSNQITAGFNSLQDTTLSGQYTALVNVYIKPVENAINDSWANYMYLTYQSALSAANKMEDGDAKTAALASADEMKTTLQSLFNNWSAMENRWNKWVETKDEEYAFEQAYEQWAKDTAEIDFEECLNNLSGLMTSTAGADTLLSVQEKRLRLQYPFEHQITEGMYDTFQYVSNLQVRVLTLYRDYTEYLNKKDCIEYATETEKNDAQERIDERTAGYKYDAEVAINTVNVAEKSCGILNLQNPESIHQTLTLKSGATIQVYRVKSNSDGKYYCIAKDSPTLKSGTATKSTALSTQYYLTDAYKQSMESSDGRYKVVSYENDGRTLNGLLANCTTNDVLLYLREEGGLTEIDADTNTLMTAKVTSEMETIHSGTTFVYTYKYEFMNHLNVRNFDINLNVADQYIEMRSDDIRDSKLQLDGIAYNQLKYLAIYCDMHAFAADTSTGSITQLSQIDDEAVLVDGDVLDLSNTYGDAQNKTIYVSGNVKIIGGGSGKEIQKLTIHVAEGANLTIENLYLTGSSGEAGAIRSNGLFNLVLEGTNKISQGSAGNAINAYVNIINGENGKLILNAGSGKCVSGGAFDAANITLETSGGSFEVDPSSGTLTNCTIISASGKYDIESITYTNCNWTNYAPYKVILQTGDMTDSGTSNDLILNIDGKNIYINDDLDKGATQTLYAYGPALESEPNKLKLKTSGSNAWYGVSVQVSSNLTDYKSIDGRWMVCQWVESQTEEIANNNYGAKLSISTDDIINAGTDANIYAALGYLDSEGNLQTGEFVNLSERIAGNAFERDADDFVYIAQNTIPSSVALEDCTFIVLKSDMANASAGWKLYRIKFQPMQAGNEFYKSYLIVEQWIVDKNYEYVFSNVANESRQYQISVKTGTKANSGTNSNISFQLVGSNGTTNWVTANDYIPGDAFEKGDTDTFMLTFDKNVGTITGVNVKSDRSGAASGWYCNTITVSEINSYYVLGSNLRYTQKISVDVYSWFDSKSNASRSFSGNSIQRLSTSNPTDGSEGTLLEVVLNRYFDDYTKLHIYRADTLDGEYVEVLDLGKDEFIGLDKNLIDGETYYYKIYEETEDGTLKQAFRIFCLKVGTGFVDIVDTKVEAETLDSDDITADLSESGYGTVSEIETTLLKELQKLNGNITKDTVAYYDLQLYYQDGNDWLPADESYFPEDGQLYVSIPVPEGSDPSTDTYYGVHMFSEDVLSKNAGDTEVVKIETHTDSDGQVYLDFYVTGLSPIAIGWINGDDIAGADNDTEDNSTTQKGDEESGMPATGDNSNLWLWWSLLITSATCITAISIEQRKRKTTN